MDYLTILGIVAVVWILGILVGHKIARTRKVKVEHPIKYKDGFQRSSEDIIKYRPPVIINVIYEDDHDFKVHELADFSLSINDVRNINKTDLKINVPLDVNVRKEPRRCV